jgi:hypothetical protein
MTRSRSNIRQANLTRVLRAMIAAGVPVARVEIDNDGKIVIVTGGAGATPMTLEEELDQDLAEFDKRHGAGNAQGYP